MNFLRRKFSVDHIIGGLTNFVEKWSFRFGQNIQEMLFPVAATFISEQVIFKIATKKIIHK